MFKRILVPVDGSRTAEAGLKTALRMVRDEKAELVLLHVVDENVLVLSDEYAGAPYLDRLMADMRSGGRKIIDKAQATAKKQGVTARTVLVESIGPRRVADIIVQQARKLRADAIVIGTHGRRGLSRMVMGSDAEEVVRASPVPVVLVRPGTREKRA
jgi:nucleotide-binding universal stress UspA family protein